jgi:hypothetical protein
MEKMQQVKQVSNPQEVYAKGRQYGLTVYLSPNKHKKYTIENPITHKLVHFGDLKYSDYTKHLDEKRRDDFRNRNKSWANAEPYSASWASYYLLW